MANFPGKSDLRAPAYFRKYVSLTADVDLTTEVHQAPNAASGLVVTNPTAGTLDLVFADCAGTEVTLEIPAGATLDIPVACTRIDHTTEDLLNVLAYWHPSVR